MEAQIVEVSGKSREEALAEALKLLDATEDQVKVESVGETESKGFLGFGAQTVINLRVRKLPSSLELARECLRMALASMDIEAEVILREQDADYLYLDLEGEDLGRVIGRHGQTLEALQLVAGLITTKTSFDRKRVVLDAAGYRERRHEKLVDEAKHIADRALRSGQQQVLRPMNSAERRVIHMAISQIEGVSTHSEGEGEERHILLVPDKKQGGARQRRSRKPASPAAASSDSSAESKPARPARPARQPKSKPAAPDSKPGKNEPSGPGRITSFGDDDIEWG
jgi:spoIIIJ-associated protein